MGFSKNAEYLQHLKTAEMRNDERRKSLQSLEFPFILIIPTCFKKANRGYCSCLQLSVCQSVCYLLLKHWANSNQI